jgi:hypothetical protein
MDGTVIWMLILAGAIVALLGAFLAISEKELRKKRRELASLAAKLSRGTTAAVGSGSENNIFKLESTNKGLQEQLSSISSRLESTERKLSESESARSRLKNVDTEKRQLEISNQKLNDELADLRQQMTSALKSNNDSRCEKAAYDEQLAKVASELKYTMDKLEQSEARIKELASATDPSALSSAQRSLTESRIEFEKNIKSLERELADSQKKLQSFDTVNQQLLDVEQREEKALFENRQLQQEITRWQERLADSEEAQRRLGIIRQQMDDVRSRGEMPNQQSQKQLENWVELLEIQPSSRKAAQSGISFRSTASAQPSSMGGSEHMYGQSTGLDAVREYLEPRRYEHEIIGGDTDLRQSPRNRTAQLSNLLASIRLHGSNTHQEQIDSLKHLTDPSETDRQVMRDIFLARADEAQKRGRDEEMLRYRNWAKNIGYHTSFGIEEMQELAEHQAAENNRNFARSSDLTTMDTIPTTDDATARNTEPASVLSGGTISPARNVALGMGIGLGLVLILLVQLLFGTSSEVTVAADDASTPPTSRTDVIPNKQHSSETSPPGASYGNATPIEALRSEGRVRARTDDVKTGRSTAKETGATANRSQSVWGAYTIVKPTPVFSEPSEDSAFITSLDAGTQVNVVAARQGWYEIRSKTGRPPGFIRQEAGSRNR